MTITSLLFAASLLTAPADVFKACTPGHIASGAITEPQRPLWRGEGFPDRSSAETFLTLNHPDGMLVQLTVGAKNPWIAVWNTGPFDPEHYLGPTHWPIKTYSAGELQEATGDMTLHELFQEPWAAVSTGSAEWPIAIVFEASAPCTPEKSRSVHH